MPFRPGQSGNPGRRPKILTKVRELAAVHAIEAIETLVLPVARARGTHGAESGI